MRESLGRSYALIRRVCTAGSGLLIAAATSLASCSTEGLDADNRGAEVFNSSLRTLIARAKKGDKNAQLELGIRYEEGRGVPLDKARAILLYKMAASSTRQRIWVYSPPVSGNDAGRVIPIDTGVQTPGLTEAQIRLNTLTARHEK